MKILNNKQLLGLTLYIFIAIFQPPFLPYDFIYIFLIITLILIGLDTRFNLDLQILRDSKILFFIKVVVIMFVQLIIVNLVDVLFIEQSDLFSNRIRVINQLVILTGEELLAVYYVLTKVKKYRIDRYSFFNLLFIVGTLQGILSVMAFFVPTIRNFFLKYSGSVFENAWVLERRGYGFSAVLVDTFGYGMALIAGTCLLISKKNSFQKLFSISLMIFCIFVNARTGIVIFLLALMIYIFKNDSIVSTVFKITIAGVVVFLLYYWFLPLILQWGIKSDNNTVRWVVSDFYELYYSSGSSNNIQNLDFVSSIIHLPTNAFEFIFGSGHSVYGTRSILGFATDIGYLNLFWTYGIVGSMFFLSSMLFLMFKTYASCMTKDMKLILIFNLIAYYLVLVKGILLGYNPGTMTMYFMIFFNKLF